MKEYHAIVAAGAKTLETVMRKTALAERVFVFAIHGAGSGPAGYGRIVARPDSAGPPGEGDAPYGFTAITPPGGDRWEGVPYADYHVSLYEACRRAPLF